MAGQGGLRMGRLGNSLYSLILGKLKRLVCLSNVSFLTHTNAWISTTLQLIPLALGKFLQPLIIYTKCKRPQHG